MLTDPGAVPKGNATKENIQRMGFEEGQVIFKCPKCCSIKPDRAHHCSVCQRWEYRVSRSWHRATSTWTPCTYQRTWSHPVIFRCIKKMDHHCPWVNNCVGERNQKFFVLFTLYIGLMSYHSLFLGLYIMTIYITRVLSLFLSRNQSLYLLYSWGLEDMHSLLSSSNCGLYTLSTLWGYFCTEIL